MSAQPDLFGAPPPLYPSGFRYHADAITVSDETRLIAAFAPLPFREFQFRGYEGKRRVVSFGWKYDFTTHQVLKADPIPDFLLAAYERLQATTGFGLRRMEQVLVTEYAAGAGIGWHKDRPVFGEVMGLSLASPCTLRLRRKAGGKWQRVAVPAAPRSAYFFEGTARWEWEHSIPPVEQLRYSVTFRNLK